MKLYIYTSFGQTYNSTTGLRQTAYVSLSSSLFINSYSPKYEFSACTHILMRFYSWFFESRCYPCDRRYLSMDSLYKPSRI